jgi:hypothetical protein
MMMGGLKILVRMFWCSAEPQSNLNFGHGEKTSTSQKEEINQEGHGFKEKNTKESSQDQQD